MLFSEFNRDEAGLSTTTSPFITLKEAMEFNTNWVNGYFTKTQWDTYLNNYELDCLPNNEFSNCKFKDNDFYIYDNYPVLNTVCVPLSPKAALLFNHVSAKFDHGIIGDMRDALPLFGWSVLIALGASILFLVIVMCCTSLITWLLMITLGLVFITFGTLIIVNYVYTGPLNDGLNAARVKYLNFLYSHKPLLYTIAVICILLGLMVFFLICKFRKYISSAIPILSLAAKSSLKNVLLLFLSGFILCL